MTYKLRSDMLREMTPEWQWLVRRVVIRKSWRLLSWLLLPIAYAGALVAPAIILSIPFQVFHAHHYSSWFFWPIAALVAAVALSMLRLAAISWLLQLRQRVIYIEPVILFVGFLIALPISLWVFPPK